MVKEKNIFKLIKERREIFIKKGLENIVLVN